MRDEEEDPVSLENIFDQFYHEGELRMGLLGIRGQSGLWIGHISLIQNRGIH